MAQRHFDRRLTAAARGYAHKQVIHIENLSADNHTEFWNKIRSLGPRKNNEIPTKVRIDGVLYNDEATVKSKWKQDFSNLLNGNNITVAQFNDEFLQHVVNHKRELESNMTDANSNGVLNREISVNEVISATQKLKVRKAMGIDLIPNEVIKCPEVAALFSKLFNVCFSSGLLPSVWQNAWIKPIPKGASKDPYLPLNYRGISLLSCVGKTYTGIMNIRLSTFMKNNNLFQEEQNGFRQGRSCEDHIFSITSIIRNRMAVNSPTYCAFVDLEKAFDWINRDLLLYKLLCHGVDGHFYQSIKSILCNTKSCVLLNHSVRTEWFDINCGVRQGDSLSPTLFNIFINDVVDHLKSNCPSLKIGDVSLNCLLYADDMVLLGEDEDSLQCLLNELKNWCANWRVKVNETKTQVVHFRNKRSDITNYSFMYNGKELEIKNNYRYLGVILDDHLDLSHCTQTLADAAGRALGAIISKFKSLRNVGYKTFTNLFSSGVQPILEYSAGVWGFQKANDIDKIQNRAIRYFLGLHKFAPNIALNSEMGWISPSFNRYICMLRFWNRIMLKPDTELCKRLFLVDYNLCVKNWSSEIKKICNKLQIESVYDNKTACNVANVKDRVKDLMLRHWKENVIQKPKLRTYVTFKDNIDVEPYVKHCNVRQNRSLMAQIRCGVLPIRLETGRFCRLPVENRLCELCNLGKVEDEFHFVMECSLYQGERERFFNTLNVNTRDDNKEEVFRVLFRNNWREVTLYLKNIWKKRQDKLFK